MWDDILELLAIAMLADHRLRDPELVEFCHQAQFLSYLVDPDRIVPRRSLMAWFRDHEKRIDDALNAKGAKAYIKAAFEKISDTEIQPQLLQAVFAICVCDYDLHAEESEVIKIGISTWNMSLAETMDKAASAIA